MFQPVRKGLSLVEVLVIIALIAILIALFIPAFCRVHYANTGIQCRNNLKQVMMAVHQYESTGQTLTEPLVGASDAPTVKSFLFPTGCVGPDGPPEERLSWVVAVLPYLDRELLYRQFDLKAGYAGNQSAARNGIKTYLCPEAYRPLTDTTTHYVAIAGLGADAASRPAGAEGNGFMGYDRQTSRATIRDGLSNTIALMETRSNLGPWARGGISTLRGFDPNDAPWLGDGRPFGRHFGGGASMAMADGSVRVLHSGTDPQAVIAAITIAGGEQPGWLD